MSRAVISSLIRSLLVELGEDPDREGLADTPDRVARAYEELLDGYTKDPAAVLKTAFEADGYDEMVVLRDVEFHSMCEHHMLPFVGTATVAYIPNGHIVGLSKLARLVDVYAHRLQVQERMTVQIAQALDAVVHPRGYGVVLKARHMCMCSRGVRKGAAEMVTTAIGGAIKDDAKARQEFSAVAGLAP